MVKKRGTPKRRKRPARRKVTVLQRMPPRFGQLETDAGRFPVATMLPSDPIMIANFIGTLKLTEQQIAALRRPVADSEVEWKPAVKDGPPVIPYLSHNGYRDRLDAAFGLGGWGMVPVGMPKEKGTSIFAPYALCVDGVPRVYAWGEQELHKMTYGDGLEGAKSNAIVRCGKELGIARELWNRAYVDALKARKGQVVANGSTRASTPRTGYNAQEAEPITQKQRQRLWTIIKKSGRSDAEIAVWLAAVYQLDDTKRIKRGDYETICSAVEKPGPLPTPLEDVPYGRD